MDRERLLHQAQQLYRAGQWAEAERLYVGLLDGARTDPTANQMLGYIRLQQGRHDEALQLLATALKGNRDPTLLVNTGLVLQKTGRRDEALAHFDQALAKNPDFAVAWNNRGSLLRDMGRLDESLASFDRALALKPDHPGALTNRGNTLRDLERYEEALASFDAALALKPDFAVAWNNRGNALKNLERPDEALASYAKALALDPGYAEALHNRGVALAEAKRYGEALASYDRALAINPGYYDSLQNRGGVLRELKRYDQALLTFERALEIRPDAAETWYAHGITLSDLGRTADALASLDRTLALDPDRADAHNNRGNCLKELQRTQEALESYDRALALAPQHRHAFGGLATAALHLCDFARTTIIGAEIKQRVAAGKCIVPGLTLMGYCDEAEPLLQASQEYMRDRIPTLPPPLWSGTPYRHDKIRIAYLSADFRQHATSILMVELIERHDRTRFECFGISFAPDDGSALRARIAGAFDHFHDVHALTYRDVAEMLRRLEIDIAIDLNGHTRDSHPEILSYRPAPVQVNFLGFPGTMAVDFVDYIIADPTVLPVAQQAFFREKIVQLPDCYQPNDSRRAIAAATPTRAEAGLPETGFVFASFNANWKITPPVFAVWMRLLQAVPGSVLWLMDNEQGAPAHLQAEAARLGVDPARLVFTPRVRLDEHLARHRLAALFLDTLPYNAHTTGSDALWAGLPMVTCRGETFAARVGASLLYACGLPELVTDSLAEYEALALRLAREPALLAALRDRLAANRGTCALFDTERYRRNIEAAYVAMWQAAERGEQPQSFAVAQDGEAGAAR